MTIGSYRSSVPARLLLSISEGEGRAVITQDVVFVDGTVKSNHTEVRIDNLFKHQGDTIMQCSSGSDKKLIIIRISHDYVLVTWPTYMDGEPVTVRLKGFIA